jgi:NTE family protein
VIPLSASEEACVKPVSTGLNLLAWLFVRLPLGFSLPFSLLSIWWVFGGFQWANLRFAIPVAARFNEGLVQVLPHSVSAALSNDLSAFVRAAMVIALFAIGFVIAYNVSALINWTLLALNLKPVPYGPGTPVRPGAATGTAGPFANTQRIGLVLAGGGAKGAYQAGAMQAIYRFLEQHNALHKVSVISATSIGSWNALFWLAGLIEPATTGERRSAHESWWRAISAKSLTAPSWYVPLFRNSFLSALPWERSFDRIFDNEAVISHLASSPVHFYLTRCNVRSGELECVTNNPAPPPVPRVTYEVLDPRGDPGDFLAAVKAGVFASMDLPPLFPYAVRGGRQFEDGGVIDNLPITFPAIEGCDLVFILPLKASFEEVPNEKSILARFLRVMDVRQGALERGGFKLLYLYNEIAALRTQVPGSVLEQTAATPSSGPLAFALRRRNSVINVFAVCPLNSFVEQTINTLELWKNVQAGIAFDVMQAATAKLLSDFSFDHQDAVRVALVSREGHITWDANF